MRLSKYLFKTNKNETSLDEATDRLIRGCFIQKECSGIFRFTNLGLRLLNNIKNIIRHELDAIGCLEVALPILQDIELWRKSGRGNGYCGRETFTLNDRKDAVMFLSPTAEESATEMVADIINSYKNLEEPITIYQMLEKYRDEMRPRFGLMRSRQFTMKDAYSFAKNQEQAMAIYIEMYNCYLRIFKKFGITVYPVPGDTGEIGGKFCHEFVVIANQNSKSCMECSMYFDELCDSSVQSSEDFDRLKCGFIQNNFTKETKCLELGEIFYLDTHYSKPMKALFTASDGSLQPFIMGCYGIGVTRVLAYIASEFDFFPEEIAPFKYHLVGIDSEKSFELYNSVKNNLEILFDDRDQKPGVKFNDADLIGIPNRIIIGNSMEFKNCLENKVTTFNSIEELKHFLLKGSTNEHKTQYSGVKINISI